MHNQRWMFLTLFIATPYMGCLAVDFSHKTFKDWNDACISTLPRYSEIATDIDAKTGDINNNRYIEALQKTLPYQDLVNAFIAYRDVIKPDFENTAQWLNGAIPKNIFPVDLTQKNDVFKPFVSREILPAKTNIYVHGDWHGDVHSLLYFIRTLQEKGVLKKDSFELVDPATKIMFLGDVIDRGVYGIYSTYTVLRLKIANPQSMYVLRGNHEEWEEANRKGLGKEITTYVADDAQRQKDLRNIFINYFNTIPCALYLGCVDDTGITNYMQCCHGGIEIGYQPKNLLSSSVKYEYISTKDLNRKKNVDASGIDKLVDKKDKDALTALMKDPSLPLGLNTANFDPYDTKQLKEAANKRFTYGKAATEKYLKFASSPQAVLQGFIRAHQHAVVDAKDMMGKILNDTENVGVAKIWQAPTPENKNKLWSGIVCTFTLAPNTDVGQGNGYFKQYGTDKGVIKDFYGQLTLAQKFDDWRLQMFEIDHVGK
jgi:hypothetical protein